MELNEAINHMLVNRIKLKSVHIDTDSDWNILMEDRIRIFEESWRQTGISGRKQYHVTKHKSIFDETLIR